VPIKFLFSDSQPFHDVFEAVPSRGDGHPAQINVIIECPADIS
jgi:hypothetical protein